MWACLRGVLLGTEGGVVGVEVGVEVLEDEGGGGVGEVEEREDLFVAEGRVDGCGVLMVTWRVGFFGDWESWKGR